jgi:hypothetical protein
MATKVEKVIRMERDLAGRVLAEQEVERVLVDGCERQTTVRETRYDAETREVVFANRAVEPARARVIVAEAEQLGALTAAA